MGDRKMMTIAHAKPMMLGGSKHYSDNLALLVLPYSNSLILIAALIATGIVYDSLLAIPSHGSHSTYVQ